MLTQFYHRPSQHLNTPQGYPHNLGEVETAMKVLQATSARLHDALHLLLKRLITAKDPAFGGRCAQPVADPVASCSLLGDLPSLAALCIMHGLA